jgi:Kef-type K+ transport system membrane component KefB
LSFYLLGIADATPQQAFAAGAALCSTSLGTTFTLLSSMGLMTSRLGIVLSSAAMLDDMVGLVMVQIISNLGTASSLSTMTVVRPTLVSLAALLPITGIFFIKPAIHSIFLDRHRKAKGRWKT